MDVSTPAQPTAAQICAVLVDWLLDKWSQTTDDPPEAKDLWQRAARWAKRWPGGWSVSSGDGSLFLRDGTGRTIRIKRKQFDASFEHRDEPRGAENSTDWLRT